jgi:hypothetical protein
MRREERLEEERRGKRREEGVGGDGRGEVKRSDER